MKHTRALRGANLARKVAPGDIGDGAYGSGYWEGWYDIHMSTSARRGRKRDRSEDYAEGYRHGRIDGASHPFCPEWDRAHRKGRLADLPVHCPWNPATAKATPGWEPLADSLADLSDYKPAIRHLRRRTDLLQAAGVVSPETVLPPVLGGRDRVCKQGDGDSDDVLEAAEAEQVEHIGTPHAKGTP